MAQGDSFIFTQTTNQSSYTELIEPATGQVVKMTHMSVVFDDPNDTYQVDVALRLYNTADNQPMYPIVGIIGNSNSGSSYKDVFDGEFYIEGGKNLALQFYTYNDGSDGDVDYSCALTGLVIKE